MDRRYKERERTGNQTAFQCNINTPVCGPFVASQQSAAVSLALALCFYLHSARCAEFMANTGSVVFTVALSG